jgi:hypothetical protein
MITKNEMIQLLKTEYPTLQTGSDETGYTELSAGDYEAQIAEWADVRLDEQAKEAEAEAQATARAALLDRLGITADEAKLLLA